MTQLCCEHSSVRYVWLSVIIMSNTNFRVNLHYNLPKFQGTPCSKQVPYLKFKWQQRDSNPQPLSRIHNYLVEPTTTYLERENYEVLILHKNNSSYFKIKASLV